MSNSNDKPFTFTEQDYMNMFAWISGLEDRIKELEGQLGLLDESYRRPTLAKTRIYEEVPKSEEVSE